MFSVAVAVISGFCFGFLFTSVENKRRQSSSSPTNDEQATRNNAVHLNSDVLLFISSFVRRCTFRLLLFSHFIFLLKHDRSLVCTQRISFSPIFRRIANTTKRKELRLRMETLLHSLFRLLENRIKNSSTDLRTIPTPNELNGRRAELLSCNELFIYLQTDRKSDESDTQCINC